MKPKCRKTGFTIIELLTVMSIIVILISLLVPSLNAVRRYSRVVAQKGRFRNIDAGLEMFESDFGEYPDSSENDVNGTPYCGAMKLCEVMAGQDGLGFHLDSKLACEDGSEPDELYPPKQTVPYPAWYIDNLRSRKEYLEAKDIELHTVEELWGSGNTGVFDSGWENCCSVVLCDVFRSVTIKAGLSAGKRVGMPILYYRANTSKLLHDTDNPNNSDNIYNYEDNHELAGLGLPWDTTTNPPLYQGSTGPEGQVFYENTQDKGVLPIKRPYRKDSYILISAGWDGIYGTRDDVYNFAK